MKGPNERQYGSIMLQVPPVASSTTPRDTISSLISTTEFAEFGTTLSVLEGPEIRSKSVLEKSKWKQLANRGVQISQKISPILKSKKAKRTIEASIYTILGIYILTASVMNFTKALPLIFLYLAALLFLVWKCG